MKTVVIGLIFILFQLNGMAQTKSILIKGKATNTANKGISHATVKTVLSGKDFRTDGNGYFQLNLAHADTLVISALGFKTRKIAINRDDQDLIIQLDTLQRVLEEVQVNTGYQTVSANRINGSVTVLGEKALNLQVSPNILERLDGITNGLTFQVGRENPYGPQNKTNITVRGYSTINGPLDPLIVLDNFVYEGKIENINPGDIASVTVLKDAEATSIYGARGGNGVIVLTTKKAKAGEPLRIEANAGTTIAEKPDLFSVPQMSSADYIAVEEFLFENKYFDRDLGRTTFPPITPLVYLLAKKRSGQITEQEYTAERAFLEKADFRKDYTDYFYKNAVTSQYNLGITGSGKGMNYAISAGHNDSKDNYGQAGAKDNLRFSLGMQLSERVKFSLSTMYTNSRNNNRQIPTFAQLSRVGGRQSVPYMSLFDQNGRENAFYRDYNPFLIDTVGGGRLLDWHYYPYSDPQYTDWKSRLSELLGNAAIEVKILDGLNLATYYQLQRQDIGNENLYGQQSYYTRSYINRFSEINEQSGEVTYRFPKGDILARSIAYVGSRSFRAQLNLNKTYGSHRIVAMAGMEARESSSGGESWTYAGYRKDPLGYLPVDFVNVYRTLPLSGYEYMPGAPVVEPSLVNRFTSIYGNFNYIYRDRYSLSGSMRRDGSNIYGVSTNDKWKPLWSVGLGYDITKEDFFRSTAVDQLRLKATYGYSGNVDLSRSALPVATFGNNPADVGGLPSAVINSLNNPSLRWEQIRQVNFGIDFALSRWGISGSMEYYRKDGTDLYGPSDFDYTTAGGFQTIVMNVASMKGNGVDLLLKYVLDKGNFSWINTLIYNYNQSRTSKYYGPSRKSPLARLVVQGGMMITPVEGYPLYSLAAYRWCGLDASGNPQGYLNGELSTNYSAMSNIASDGQGSMGTIRFLGSAIPTSFGSWQHEFRYKGLSLSFALTYKAGYYFRKPSINYSSLINFGIGHPDYADRWQQPGDETEVPAFEYPLKMPGRDNFYLASEVLARNASHVRLKFVNLVYDLKGISKLRYLNNASLYLNVNNVALLWTANREGLDPDYFSGIPPQRMWSVGFRTSF